MLWEQKPLDLQRIHEDFSLKGRQPPRSRRCPSPDLSSLSGQESRTRRGQLSPGGQRGVHPAICPGRGPVGVALLSWPAEPQESLGRVTKREVLFAQGRVAS